VDEDSFNEGQTGGTRPEDTGSFAELDGELEGFASESIFSVPTASPMGRDFASPEGRFSAEVYEPGEQDINERGNKKSENVCIPITKLHSTFA